MTLRKPNDGESIKAYDELQTDQINEDKLNFDLLVKFDALKGYSEGGTNQRTITFSKPFKSTPAVIVNAFSESDSSRTFRVIAASTTGCKIEVYEPAGGISGGSRPFIWMALNII